MSKQVVFESKLPSPESHLDLSMLLSSAKSKLDAHIHATNAELKQVKSLMDNAIDDLVDSFISLEMSLRIEQKLVMLLAANETTNDNDEANPFRALQLKTKALLNETSKKLSGLSESSAQNEQTGAELADTIKEIKSGLSLLEKNFAQANANQAAKEQADIFTRLHEMVEKSATLASKIQTNGKVVSEKSLEVSGNITVIIEENNANIAAVAQEIAGTNTQIEQDVITAITSLQFQDLTTQLISQCMERQNMMLQIIQKLGSIKTPDAPNDVSSTDKLSELDHLLQEVSQTRMKTFNHDGGSVELFD